MGTFKVEITAVGGHGCQREVKDGEKVTGCAHPSCPDCLARNFVNQLKVAGVNVESATLKHWPDQPSEVVDDLKTGIRKGNF